MTHAKTEITSTVATALTETATLRSATAIRGRP